MIQDHRDLGALIPSALDDYGLSPDEFRIYCRIARRANGGHCWESVGNMASHCQMNVKTARKAIALLTLAGLITQEPRRGATNIITLTKSSNWASPNLLQSMRSDLTPTKSGRGTKSGTPTSRGLPTPTKLGTPPLPAEADEGIPSKEVPLRNPIICGFEAKHAFTPLTESRPEPEPVAVLSKKRSGKKSPPAVSRFHPEECRQLWELWNPFFIQQRGDRDSLAGFVQGFDELIELGTPLADVVDGTTYYLENKRKAIAAGKNTAIPPDGIRFFRGSKNHPGSYCLDALAMKRERHLPTGKPRTWRDDPRFDVWLAELKRVGDRDFVHPGWTSGDYTPDPEKEKFWNFLLKEGIINVER